MAREKFGSRLGFLLISAGCAIGIGNVWKFPYITGQYGGAAFVLIYLFFLAIFGIPLMTMEFAVGRASRKSCASSFKTLEPEGTKWHLASYFGMAGNYLLMMFYTNVSGWMLSYVFKMAKGDFANASSDAITASYNSMLAEPIPQIIWMVIAILLGFGICSLGLQKGVERVTKVMMVCLLGLMVVLSINSILLDGASEGIAFYLVPNFENLAKNGIFNAIYAAMSQALFTLSIGIGSMAIFGSYVGKDRTLLTESINITLLDTGVALMAGLIIFPACFSFGVDAGAGPGLIFETLPNIFAKMTGGRIWGTLFFVFLSFAALSTLIAVFENIISFAMDLLNWSRKKAVLVNIIAIIVLSIPCVLGFNLWSSFQPLGEGTGVLDLEDFIVSYNLLPLGCLVYLFFCTRKKGWGFKNFQEEANTGKGIKFPNWMRVYVSYILPVIVLAVFILGYVATFTDLL
ncbi:MAG: sodium-dependent transporter [Ruminococcaceae bacterium]|nr:sodium-dependent transporter [Oscillospiraceae bacterium]